MDSEFKEGNSVVKEKKKFDKKILIILAVFCILCVVVIKFKIKPKEVSIIKEADGFLYYDSNAESKFKVVGDDHVYGPYLINTTENGYLFLQVEENGDYKKIGYIDLDGSDSFSCDWIVSKYSYLSVQVDTDSGLKWYFFDQNGNMISLSNDLLSRENKKKVEQEKQNEIINDSELEDENLVVPDVSDVPEITENNIIYLDEKDYNGFKIAVTRANELILFKEINNSKVIYGKMDYYGENGKGYYADYNNGMSGNIRIRVDRYVEGIESRYSYIWYEYNSNGNLINTDENIDGNSYVYSYQVPNSDFYIGITNINELILYKNVDQYKSTMAIIKDYYGDVSKQEYNFYADYNNSDSGNIRIRIDKFIDGNPNKYGVIWYEYDSNGNLIDNSESINSEKFFSYISPKMYGDFKIAITSDNRLVMYKDDQYNSDKANIFANLDYYGDVNKLDSQSYSHRFYADFNNGLSGNIRIRVDKFINNSDVRYSYIWYEYTASGDLISVQEYIDTISFIYTSPKTYGDFYIGITNNKELVLYTDIHNVHKVIAKVPSYVSNDNLLSSEYVTKNGPGFYADYNNGESGNIRIRVDRYVDGSDKRYGYIWYEFNSSGDLISQHEYLD